MKNVSFLIICDVACRGVDLNVLRGLNLNISKVKREFVGIVHLFVVQNDQFP